MKPVNPLERIHLLDIIRGFALLGVLVMNIQDFSGYGYALDETKMSFASYDVDKLLIPIIEVVFQGKFYAIFSILFGIGFSIQLERLRMKTDNWKRIFYRRLTILLVLGYIHMQFVWNGDILMLYALLGFLLPLFSQQSNRQLLIWAVVFLSLPFLIDLIFIHESK